tara:strand:+ start:691 stop:1086 length:396 start_codon:yes stop_codon:yes gene_type:complete
MHPNQRRGSASEYTAAAYFSEHGWEIFWPPTGASPCDFIMVKEDQTQRVQIKTAVTWRKGPSTYLRVKLSGNNNYKPGDFDLLGVVGPESRMWVIPFDKLPERSMIYLEKHNGPRERDYGWGEYEVKRGES